MLFSEMLAIMQPDCELPKPHMCEEPVEQVDMRGRYLPHVQHHVTSGR